MDNGQRAPCARDCAIVEAFVTEGKVRPRGEVRAYILPGSKCNPRVWLRSHSLYVSSGLGASRWTITCTRLGHTRSEEVFNMSYESLRVPRAVTDIVPLTLVLSVVCRILLEWHPTGRACQRPEGLTFASSRGISIHIKITLLFNDSTTPRPGCVQDVGRKAT